MSSAWLALLEDCWLRRSWLLAAEEDEEDDEVEVEEFEAFEG